MLQGYQESDFVNRSPGQIQSWPDLITTLVALTEIKPQPTEDEVTTRLRRLRAN